MKNTRIIIVLLIIGFGALSLNAQKGTVAAGGLAKGSNGSVSYSYGQVVYITETGINGHSNQGIQQPYIEKGNGIYKIEGYITYENKLSSVIDKGWVCLMNKEKAILDSVELDRTNYYKFENVAEGDYIIEVKPNPDLFGWNGVNPQDALKVIKYYLGTTTIGLALQMLAADVNDDKNINPQDALWINKRYLGTSPKFNIPDWLQDLTPFTVNKDTQHDIKMICAGDVNSSYPN